RPSPRATAPPGWCAARHTPQCAWPPSDSAALPQSGPRTSRLTPVAPSHPGTNGRAARPSRPGPRCPTPYCAAPRPVTTWRRSAPATRWRCGPQASLTTSYKKGSRRPVALPAEDATTGGPSRPTFEIRLRLSQDQGDVDPQLVGHLLRGLLDLQREIP